MILLHRCDEGRLVSTEGLGEWTPPKSGGVWIEVVQPDETEVRQLQERVGLHELAIEDALKVGHPPKIEEFDDHLFVVAHTPEYDSETGTRKIGLFLAKTWLVTIARAPLVRVEDVKPRVQAAPKRYLEPPAVLAHYLLDWMTDGFEHAVETMIDRIEDLEERVALDPTPDIMHSLNELRHEAVALVRVVRSQRDVSQALSRSEHASLPKKLRPYLRDVYDHLVRVHEMLESARDALNAVRDTYLSAINNRLSEVMRTLTIIATIMMPLSLVAGVYGMNFHYMPGLASPLGFWVTMAAMVGVAGGMLVWFRRRGWL